MSHIKTNWTPTSSMSTYNTAQTVSIHPEIIPDHSVCLYVHEHMCVYVCCMCVLTRVYTFGFVGMCVGHTK